MKVERPSGPRSTAPGSKTSRVDGGGFASLIEGPQATEVSKPAGAVADVGSLLALQAVGEEGADSGAHFAKKRGKKVLDALSALQCGLLSGTQDIDALSQAAALPRPSHVPNALRDVLDAIDVRASVELAKIKRKAIS